MSKDSLQQIGIGIVTANKPSGEKFAEVFLLEQAQLAKEEVNSKDKETITLDLADGTSKQITVEDSFKVKAKWLRLGDSQRITPPDLVIGQHVMVYNKPGYDEFYWVKIYEENDIALQEVVTYGFMAKNKNDKAEVDPAYMEKMYRLTVSTKDGEIRFKTTDANEEQTTYNFWIDTCNGNFGFEDKQGNFSMFDSVNGVRKSNITKGYNSRVGETINQYILKNLTTKVDGEHNLYVGSIASMELKGDYNFKGSGAYNFDNNGDYNIKNVGMIQFKTMKEMIFQANQDYTILSNGGKITIISGSGVSISAPTIDLVGVVNCGTLSCGALNIGGAAPQPPTLKQANIPGAKMDNLKDALKVLDEETKVEEKEKEGEGGSTGKSRFFRSGKGGGDSEEKEDDPWKDETKPTDPEKLQEPDKSVSNFEKECEINAKAGMKTSVKGEYGVSSEGVMSFETQAEMKMKSQIAKLEATMATIKAEGGLSLQGAGGDLMDLLSNVVDVICTAIDVPHGSASGPTVPTMAGTVAAQSLKPLLTAFKGGATRSASTASFRARSLGLPEPEEELKKPEEIIEEIKSLKLPVVEPKKNKNKKDEK